MDPPIAFDDDCALFRFSRKPVRKLTSVTNNLPTNSCGNEGMYKQNYGGERRVFICFPRLFSILSDTTSQDSAVLRPALRRHTRTNHHFVATKRAPNLVILLHNETATVLIRRGRPFDGPQHKSYFRLFLREETQWEWTPDSDHWCCSGSGHRGGELEPKIRNKSLQ